MGGIISDAGILWEEDETLTLTVYLCLWMSLDTVDSYVNCKCVTLFLFLLIFTLHSLKHLIDDLHFGQLCLTSLKRSTRNGTQAKQTMRQNDCGKERERTRLGFEVSYHRLVAKWTCGSDGVLREFQPDFGIFDNKGTAAVAA